MENVNYMYPYIDVVMRIEIVNCMYPYINRVTG